MSDLSIKSKKELIEIIQQMQDKLTEMRDVEKQVIIPDSELLGTAFSIFQDKADKFHLISIKYNSEKLVAKIEKVEDLSTKSFENAMFRGKKELVEKIMNKKQLNHLTSKKVNN